MASMTIGLKKKNQRLWIFTAQSEDTLADSVWLGGAWWHFVNAEPDRAVSRVQWDLRLEPALDAGAAGNSWPRGVGSLQRKLTYRNLTKKTNLSETYDEN